jgi:acyl-CoA synthetase (AMP-forming)/AMP-acid ligase II
MTTTRERPWLRDYDGVPASLDDPRLTLYEAVAASAQRTPEAVAWNFFGTTEELPPGEEGGICIAGLAVMLGFFDDPRATAETPEVLADGRAWRHTGDQGRRDADGFFHFTVRAKRMIEFCRERLIKRSCPREIELRRQLPKTHIGKVVFKVLAAEHIAGTTP